MSAPEPLVRYLGKLERRGAVHELDRRAILSLPGRTLSIPADRNIVTEGDVVSRCIIVQSGIVSRVKTIKSGARQIVGINIPGDAVDLQRLLFSVADHSIYTHTDTVIFSVSHDDILALTDRSPTLTKTLWQDTLVDAAIFREWAVNLGQRRARERIAHLMLELSDRFASIGALRDSTFDLPLTQRDLADALGMSLVHLNKSIQSLRREGLLTIAGREITLERKERLIEMCGFNRDYLSLDGPSLPGLTAQDMGTSRWGAGS